MTEMEVEDVAAGSPANSALERTGRGAILPGVISGIEAEVSNAVEERRVVTVLFSDVVGSTALAGQMDPEDWAEIMAGLFDYLIKPVERYGGNVARLLGDAILAFFGAPAAHEDDPERAILAGLDIVNGIKPYAAQVRAEFGIDLNVRVGINTGLVVLGEFGAERSFEYTALGDAINLAARMEQTAEPGTVQIAEDTYRLVAPLFEIEPLGQIEVKGKPEPVPAYRVLSRKDAPGRLRGLEGSESPLVGRDSELEQLRRALQELKVGRGRIISLIGDAGLGKSRLIEETHRIWEELTPKDAEGSQPSWIEERAVSYESARPYAIFVENFRRLLSIEEGDSNELIQKRIQDWLTGLPQDFRETALPVVERILALSPTDGDAAGADDLDLQSNDALIAQLHALIARTWKETIEGSPTVCVLDDLHWADSSSIDLIVELLRLTDEIPVLFVCAMRPTRDAPSWRVEAGCRIELPAPLSGVQPAGAG